MPRFRKRPVVIEAVQWTGDNVEEIELFLDSPEGGGFQGNEHVGYTLIIPTEEGELFASEGDWIIRGVEGEYYPCKPGIFEQTYEPVGEGPINAAEARVDLEGAKRILEDG